MAAGKVGFFRFFAFFGLLHISLFVLGSSVDTLRINEKTDDLELEKGVQFFHDSNNLFDHSDIYDEQLFDSLRQPYSPGYYKEGNLWARFYLENESDEKEEFILEVDAYSEIYVFYRSINESQFQEKVTGQYVPFPKDEMGYNIFRMNKVKLALKPNVPYEVIVYYPHTGEEIKSSLTIFAFEKWVLNRLKRSENVKIFLGLFFGVTLFLALVNFIYYFLYWQKAYIFYSIYIFSIVYFIASIHGILDASRLIESPIAYYFLEYISLTLMVILYFFFLKSFLNTKARYPIWDKLINILIIAHIIGLFISFWLVGVSKLPITSLEVRSYFIILTLVVGIIFLINLSIKGDRLDKIFLAGSAALFVSGIFSLVVELFFTRNNYPDLLFQIGIVAELIVFSIGLRIKSRIAEKEKQVAQEELISQLKENENLQLSINQELEIKVTQRTKEIQAQNEELTSQQEELAAHRDMLEGQNKIIAQNMVELQKVKAQLEDTVVSRTQQLQIANQELVQHNNQLEQYAYITAHNLRAPVARLKGLMYIFEKTGGVTEEHKDIIEKISGSALEMDEVLTDINAILELKNNNYGSTQLVEIAKIVEKSRKILAESLDESKAEMNLNLQVAEVHAIEPYLESIFYNLISNAIKYQSVDRRLQINISSYPDGANVILEVKDNGIGMDLEQFGSKLFGLYQRFHDHVGGKGLGLYLVKTQVEALGGSVGVESEVGKGSTFRIAFPG